MRCLHGINRAHFTMQAWPRRHDLEAGDSRHDRRNESQPKRIGKLPQQRNAKQHCPDSANAGLDGKCGLDRQNAEIKVRVKPSVSPQGVRGWNWRLALSA
jgi:hypothetical protein